MSLDTPHVRKLIALAIDEDLGFGDITSDLTIPDGHSSKAKFILKEQAVVCGTELISLVFEEMKAPVQIKVIAADGATLSAGSTIAEIAGPTRSLLSGERTILNFLQRLSGIATYTRRVTDGLKQLAVLDTRKTMPGWRALEKYATRVGGARNHRTHLGDMVMIKNNHIDAAQKDIPALMAQIKAKKPLYMPVEVEVRNPTELEQALKAEAEIVMLDNMNDEQISSALATIKKLRPATHVEVSGGITKERLAKLDAMGVESVSMGALTTQATNVDISMRIYS